jgi:threonine aldolase
MSLPVVDLRSDTVTQPTPEMRAAMADAVVGDDGYHEDPTVSALERRFAGLVGKESAIFVPSGTMANQIALRCLTSPGDLVLAGSRQHIVLYELGASAANASVQIHCLDDAHGRLDPEEIRTVRDGVDHVLPTATALFLENSHMASGGRAATPEELAEVLRAASGLRIHLDGARLFNAQVATGRPAADLAASAETVMACLSKGLCCPVGSLLAGPAELMERGRLHRKRLGGAMRQAGILAAAGLVALDQMVDRLADDHARAGLLRSAAADRWPEQAEAISLQHTNMVVFVHPDPPSLLGHLSEAGVLGDTLAPGVVRLVTHHDVDDAGAERAALALRSAP